MRAEATPFAGCLLKLCVIYYTINYDIISKIMTGIAMPDFIGAAPFSLNDSSEEIVGRLRLGELAK